MTRPFMEHPSGEFGTAVDAMADAIMRLRSLAQWDEWITFCAQGMGARVDSYRMADIRMRRNLIHLKSAAPIDVAAIVSLACVSQSCLAKDEGFYSLANASPQEAARVMDTIYRHHMGIRPHTGEGNDYAIGAEW
jgi:hypothetical protein